MTLRILALLAGMGVSMFSVAAAQEAPAAAPPAEVKTPASPAQAEYQKVFAAWKNQLKEIRTVQVKYQDATQSERGALHEQFEKLVAEARTMVPQLTAAAEKAYVDAPNADPELMAFMSQVVADNVERDNYEEAARLSKLMLDNNAPNKRLYLLGGIAAFNVNDYDLAEKYLTAAQQAGELEQPSDKTPESLKNVIQSGAMYLSMIDQYKAMWEKEQKIRAAEAQADDLPRVKLETSKGDIVIELFENEAPNSVANFLELVGKGYYDGLKFHRVIQGFMAQGGDPTGTGSGGPGYSIACECVKGNHRKHFRGTLSMAHAGPDTGGSQFFLTFVPTAHLDGKHTAFGRVVEGFPVLAEITRIEPGAAGEPDKIVKATVLRKRNHEYVVKKLPK